MWRLAGRGERPGGGPPAGGGIVELGAGEGIDAAVLASGDQHLARGQERRRVELAGRGERPGGGPPAGRGVVELGAGERMCRRCPGLRRPAPGPRAGASPCERRGPWRGPRWRPTGRCVGSYSSALASGWPALSWPPATSTWPEGRSVAVWTPRPVASAPVVAHRPVVGSYSSALASGWPALSCASGDQHLARGQERRRVARRGWWRGTRWWPTGRSWGRTARRWRRIKPLAWPPATSTWPEGRSVAV